MDGWRSASRRGRAADDGHGGVRSRPLALTGLGSSALFALVVLATQVPVLVPGACD